MTKSIYIAGPMSGIPEFNFPAFFATEEKLRAEGWNVFNPANKDAEKELDPEAFATGDHVLVNKRGFDFRTAYLWDVTKVIEGDAIYMLKGWERSPGAIGEHACAVAMQKHHPEYEIIYE
jgi:hypothetical protein